MCVTGKLKNAKCFAVFCEVKWCVKHPCLQRSSENTFSMAPRGRSRTPWKSYWQGLSVCREERARMGSLHGISEWEGRRRGLSPTSQPVSKQKEVWTCRVDRAVTRAPWSHVLGDRPAALWQRWVGRSSCSSVSLVRTPVSIHRFSGRNRGAEEEGTTWDPTPLRGSSLSLVFSSATLEATKWVHTLSSSVHSPLWKELVSVFQFCIFQRRYIFKKSSYGLRLLFALLSRIFNISVLDDRDDVCLPSTRDIVDFRVAHGVCSLSLSVRWL